MVARGLITGPRASLWDPQGTGCQHTLLTCGGEAGLGLWLAGVGEMASAWFLNGCKLETVEVGCWGTV